MNKIIICGNLTADPVITEVEYTNRTTGEIIKTKVCNFTVACDDGFGESKMTQYFRVNSWRGQGETCMKYLKKGREVLVEGPVKLNTYVDKNNVARSSMEVRANSIQFLRGGKNANPPEENVPEEEEALY